MAVTEMIARRTGLIALLPEYTRYDAAEAVESKRHYGSGRKRYGNSAERLRRQGLLHPFTHAGEYDPCKQESEAASKGADHGLQEIVAVGDVIYGHAEHRTVCGDKRKINAERFMQRWQVLFEHYLNELHERGYNEYEDDSLEIPHAVGIEQIRLYRPRNGSGEQHNEYDRDTHVGSLIEFLRNAEERADPEEFA